MTDQQIPAFIETASGGKFYFLDPVKSDFCIEDIATALSRICRFNGHTKKFYSVAEHCVLLARWCRVQGWSQKLILAALLHDAGEAYLGDVAKPLKMLLPDYKALEQKCDAAVLHAFGIVSGLPPEIKEIDIRILLDERAQAMPDTENDWGRFFDGIEPLDVILRFWSPAMARVAFMNEFTLLNGEKNGGY